MKVARTQLVPTYLHDDPKALAATRAALEEQLAATARVEQVRIGPATHTEEPARDSGDPLLGLVGKGMAELCRPTPEPLGDPDAWMLRVEADVEEDPHAPVDAADPR